MSNASEYQKFEQWLLSRGRTETTAVQYSNCVRKCLSDPRGAFARLSLDDLAPKTRHANKAAMRAWANYKGLEKLKRRLADIKLPPPDRVKEKRALEPDKWAAVIDALDGVRDRHMQAVLKLVCCRGFRIGDVCRLERSIVAQGLLSGVLVYVSKGRRRLSWTVTDDFRPALMVFAKTKGWRYARDILAPNSADRPRVRQKAAVQNVQRRFGSVLRRAGVSGLGVSLHTMRRTYAWHFLKECEAAGIEHPLVKLQKHMGWASLQTASQYVDQSERDELDKLAAAMSARLHS
jgi:integrase